MIMIDKNLGITSDKHNLILVQNPKERKDKKGWAGRHTYYPNFRLMVKAIVDLKGLEFLARGMPESIDKSSGTHDERPQIKHLDSVIAGYCDYLQKHLENITKK